MTTALRHSVLSAFVLCFALFSNAQNALNFDGTDDYVQTSYPGVSGTANRTFEAWVYVQNSASSNMCILDYGLNAVGSRNTFSVGPGDKLVYISGGTNANISSPNGTFPIAQWNHVAFVLENGVGYLYVNGTQVGTGSLTTVNTPTGQANMTIGERVMGGSIPFSGIIDEVRIWNYARTASEIMGSMNAEFCQIPVGLEVYYKANSGVASGSNAGVTTLVDDASGSFDGTLTNFALSGSTSNWVLGSGISSGNTTVSFQESACNQYVAPSGAVFDTTGIYTDIIPNAAGCDSVMTIDVDITEVNVDVTENGDQTLTANQGGAFYQWLSCTQGFAPVSGATSQTFVPTQIGQYAVEITYNGCVDTSNCYNITSIGLTEFGQELLEVFPNPAVGRLHLQATQNGRVSIFDATGKLVYKSLDRGLTHEIDLEDWAPGNYVLRFKTASGVHTRSVQVR
ncbi:T9SS type A sorting domain-containing protein [Cryomorphaceae bacterium]|nr:T9SS type A sorting domain-containing protein [Cryomorphaceae bacterium]